VTLPLFVYGSLRDPRVRARLLGQDRDLRTCPAVLRGHARQEAPGFDYPFVVPADADARVEGELLLGLEAADYAVLDRYEDLEDGLYRRVAVTVETPDGRADAWTYLKGPAASLLLTSDS
jgi:gamma-glutamylcyclotransferase (GGCT)/AIG2-like uncharacterized protein YtfP